MTKQEQINNAKEVLRQAGYFVDNLWHIQDVMGRYECDEDDAMIILESALTDDYIMEQINVAIDEDAFFGGYKRKNDNN